MITLLRPQDQTTSLYESNVSIKGHVFPLSAILGRIIVELKNLLLGVQLGLYFKVWKCLLSSDVWEVS